jgi:hypothetical protein
MGANAGKVYQGLWYWCRTVRAELGGSEPCAMKIGLGRIYAHHAPKLYAIFRGSAALHNARQYSTIRAMEQVFDKDSATQPDSAQGIDEHHLFDGTHIRSTISRQLMSIAHGPLLGS